MSGPMTVAMRANDGSIRVIDGYSRSAYGVFSYPTFFDGDDAPSIAFMDGWIAEFGAETKVTPSEGALVVDFPTRRILVDFDRYDANIEDMDILRFEQPFNRGAIDRGRMSLRSEDGTVLLVLPNDFGRSRKFLGQRFSMSFTHAREIAGDEVAMGGTQYVVDMDPWKVEYHPDTLGAGIDFFDKVRSCGFEIDPDDWRRRDDGCDGDEGEADGDAPSASTERDA